MKFKWKKFCDVGNHLKKFSSEEEYQRSSISRYYYSCFNIVKLYFEKNYYSLGRKNVHQNLIKGLDGRSDEEEFLSETLDKLRRYRNNADYDEVFQRSNIKNTENSVKDIFSTLNELET